MSRAQQYEGARRPAMVSDLETWAANSLATILAGLAIAGGVIGWFVAFGYITTSADVTQFEGGMVWMVGAIVLGLAANVFRREHHVVDHMEGGPKP